MTDYEKLRRSPHFLRVVPTKSKKPRKGMPRTGERPKRVYPVNLEKIEALFTKRPHLQMLRLAAAEANIPLETVKKPDRTLFTTRLRFDGVVCEIRNTNRAIEKHNIYTDRSGVYARFELKAAQVVKVPNHLFIINTQSPDVLRAYLIPSLDLLEMFFAKNQSAAELLIRIDDEGKFEHYRLTLPLRR